MAYQSPLTPPDEVKKTHFLELGFAFAIVVMISLLGLMSLFSRRSRHSETVMMVDVFTDPSNIKDLAMIPLQQPASAPPPVLNTVPTITFAEEATDEEVSKKDQSVESTTGAQVDSLSQGKGLASGIAQPGENDGEEPIPFELAEDNPLFPGGSDALQKFLKDNIKYPRRAEQANISGRVIIAFVVEKDGSVSQVKVYKGIGGGCNEEATRVVAMMPRWTPGRQHDKAVRVLCHVPVEFILGAR